MKFSVSFGRAGDSSSTGSADLHLVSRICLEESEYSDVSGERNLLAIVETFLQEQVLKSELPGDARSESQSPSLQNLDSKAHNRYSIEEAGHSEHEDEAEILHEVEEDLRQIERIRTEDEEEEEVDATEDEEEEEEEEDEEEEESGEESGEAGDRREEDEEDESSAQEVREEQMEE